MTDSEDKEHSKGEIDKIFQGMVQDNNFEDVEKLEIEASKNESLNTSASPKITLAEAESRVLHLHSLLFAGVFALPLFLSIQLAIGLLILIAGASYWLYVGRFIPRQSEINQQYLWAFSIASLGYIFFVG